MTHYPKDLFTGRICWANPSISAPPGRSEKNTNSIGCSTISVTSGHISLKSKDPNIALGTGFNWDWTNAR